MLRGKASQFLIHGFEADEVALGFDSKVVEGVADFQALGFAVGERGGQKVIDLCGHGFGGRLAQGSMLFERLMKFFDFPPSVVNRCNLGLVQVRVSADQLQHTPAAVLVGKGLAHDEQS